MIPFKVKTGFLFVLAVLLLNMSSVAQQIKSPPKKVLIKQITPIKKNPGNKKKEEAIKEERGKEVKKQEEKETSDGVEIVVNMDGVDKTFVMARKYDNSHFEFYEGLARVEYEGKWGYVNERFEEVVSPKYKLSRDYNEGMAAVCNDEYKWAFLDKRGKVMTPFKYDDAFYFFNGYSIVHVGNKSGFVNKTGKELFPIHFDRVSIFSEGLAWVRKGERSAYIDTTGKEILVGSYWDGRPFHEGLAAVLDSNSNWGFINKKGELVIPCQFSSVKKDFEKGRAEVETAYEKVKVSPNSYYLKAQMIAIDTNGNKVQDLGSITTGTKEEK